MSRKGRWRILEGLAWTSPWWLGFLLFLAGPLAVSLYLSFCDYPILQPPVFVGLDNYTTLLHDPVVHKVLFNTLVYAVLSITLGNLFAILLAALLNQPVRGQAVFRACLFLPSVVPTVASGVVWGLMLNPEYGLVNQVLRLVGIEGPLWLTTPRGAMAALILVTLWTTGSTIIIYLAAMQEIPAVLYEAAVVDGAGPLWRFIHVTVPGLSPVILFNCVLGIITSWQVFALPYVLFKATPGPGRSTYFYTMYLFDNAFRYLKMGYASALGWIQFLIILAATGLLFAGSRRLVHYRGAK